MLTTTTIKQIIETGTLKSYWIDSSFIEVYWSHPSLEINNYYLFKFTTLKQDLISVKQITAVEIPRRYKMKKMQPMVNGIMQELLKAS